LNGTGTLELSSGDAPSIITVNSVNIPSSSSASLLLGTGGNLTVGGGSISSLNMSGGILSSSGALTSGGITGYGTISGAGTLTLASGSPQLAVVSNPYFTQTLDLSGINFTNISGGTLSGADLELSGTLKLGGNISTNSGFIQLNDSTSQILNASGTNALAGLNANWSGLLSVNGSATFATTGNFANNAGSGLSSSGGTISITGQLSNDATSTVQVGSGGTLTAGSVNNSGQFLTGNAAGDTGYNTVNVAGAFTNSGLLNIEAAGDHVTVGSLSNGLGSGVTIGQGATLTVNGNVSNTAPFVAVSPIFSVGGISLGGGTLSVAGSINPGVDIANAGYIQGWGTVQASGSITSSVLQAEGGTLDLSGTNLTNLSGGTLTGGFLGGGNPGSTLKLPGDITTNSGIIDLGGGGQILDASNNSALAGFNANQGGEFSLVAGTFTTGGNFLNNGGSLLYSASSTLFSPGSAVLTINGNLTNSNSSSVEAFTGIITVNGNLSNDSTSSVSVAYGGGGLNAASVNNSGNFSTGGGNSDPGHNTVNVTGTFTNNAGGVLNLMASGDQVTVGTLTNNGGVTVNAGTTLTSGTATIGSTLGSSGSVTVTGTGAQWNNTGTLTVGGAGFGTLAVTNGGLVTSAGATVGATAGSIGVVILNASTWNNGTSPLTIGVNGTGVVTLLNGSTLTTGTTTVGANGSLTGDPSNIDVFGNFTLQPYGVLTLDIGGTGVGDYSVLDITGTGTFQGIIDLDFIDGYLPKTGDTLDLINALSSTFSGATINIEGLGPGFLYSDGFSNGQFDLTALNNATSPTPEPQSFALALTGLAAFGIAYRRKRAKAKRS
jgi:T5SS/PEP-CTERM-associated repeat protein